MTDSGHGQRGAPSAVERSASPASHGDVAPPPIEARALGKAFGRTWALRNVDLDVARGERVALLGPNGAGKTTLMRLLSTLSRPTRGTLRVCGLDPSRDARNVRARIGVVGHTPSLYDDLSARENLEFYAKLYGVPDPAATYAPLLERAGLGGAVAERPVRAYSRGMQQKLALIRALLHAPELLLLDEPDTGLDRAALAFLEEVVRGGGSDRTVVFTTHNHELGLKMADRVLLLAGAAISYDAPAGALDASRLRDAYRELAEVCR